MTAPAQHFMRFTVRTKPGGGVLVNVWMGSSNDDLAPRGDIVMSLSEFAFFRVNVLISSKVSIVYEPGVKASIDAVEKAEYVKAERFAALRGRS